MTAKMLIGKTVWHYTSGVVPVEVKEAITYHATRICGLGQSAVPATRHRTELTAARIDRP